MSHFIICPACPPQNGHTRADHTVFQSHPLPGGISAVRADTSVNSSQSSPLGWATYLRVFTVLLKINEYNQELIMDQ